QGGVVVVARQAAQIKVPAGHEVGAGGQGGHLAVAGVQQPGLAGQVAHAVDQGDIQRVVGALAGVGIAGQDVPGRLGGRAHALQLGQVGSVLAPAELPQAAGADLVGAVVGGAVQAHGVQGQVVDVEGGLPEVGLDEVPVGLGQAAQDDAQAVVAEVGV